MAQVHFWGSHTKAQRGWKWQGREETFLNSPAASGIWEKTYLFLICWDCGMKPKLPLCYQTWELWHNNCFYVWWTAEAAVPFPFFCHVGGLLCGEMNLPNCIAFSYPIFLRAFLCTQNLSKGTESLQTSSLHSCNYGNSAVNMQNNHSGPSTRTCTLSELCLMCFKKGSLGSCYTGQRCIRFVLAETGIHQHSQQKYF